MVVVLFELSLTILVLWLMFTQVLLPGRRGTKLFPAFRREGQLIGDLEGALQAKREHELQDRIAELRDDTAIEEPLHAPTKEPACDSPSEPSLPSS